MYGFIIKKNFCDGWDNLFTVVLINVMYLLIAAGTFVLVTLSAKYCSEIVFVVVSTILLALGVFLLSIIAFAWGEQAAKIADFNGTSLKEFFRAIPGVIVDAILFVLLIFAIGFVSFFSIRYYFAQPSMIGLCIGSLLLWIDLFIALSLQWFVPIRSTMHNKFGKTLKKCFIIFFDNTGFSILMGLNNLVALIITIVFIGFTPSVAGMLINKANALRIRLYKYDYLEEHPELKTKQERRQIPWEELIFEDRETVGKRNLKSFLFPWKEQ